MFDSEIIDCSNELTQTKEIVVELEPELFGLLADVKVAVSLVDVKQKIDGDSKPAVPK